MEYKNTVSVRVCGKTMTLSGNESVEYITKVAEYIEKKAEEIRNSDNSKSLSANMVSVLTSINIADDYFKEIEKNNHLLHELELATGDSSKNMEALAEAAAIQAANDSLEQKHAKELEIMEERLAEITLQKDVAEANLLKMADTLKEAQDALVEKDKIIEENTTQIEKIQEELIAKIAKINHLKSVEHKSKKPANNSSVTVAEEDNDTYKELPVSVINEKPQEKTKRHKSSFRLPHKNK